MTYNPFIQVTLEGACSMCCRGKPVNSVHKLATGVNVGLTAALHEPPSAAGKQSPASPLKGDSWAPPELWWSGVTGHWSAEAGHQGMTRHAPGSALCMEAG